MATNTPKNTTITSTTPVGVPNLPGAPAPLVLPARPEPVALHAANSALIVVDMQNAYASIGGYVDSAGFDISGTQGTIANIARTIEASRAAGILVVFLQNGWDAGYVEAGGPGSPNWYKSNALKTMRKKPELQGKFLAKGGWDSELIDAMLPQAGDIVISKTRYSGFFNSTLDSTGSSGSEPAAKRTARRAAVTVPTATEPRTSTGIESRSEVSATMSSNAVTEAISWVSFSRTSSGAPGSVPHQTGGSSLAWRRGGSG